MKTYNEPKQLITSKKGSDLNSRYNKERSELISKSIEKEDANAFWYSLEELENYINYVKVEGEKQNLEVNGIRFYLGVYPNDTNEYKHKAGLTTIFMTPTILKNSSDDVSDLVSRTAEEYFDESDLNEDVTTISPMNYGGIGHPPKKTY